MEILWWLAPAGAVTVLAMLWVSWLGREGHGELDRDAAAARLARALDSDRSVRVTPPARPRERSTGIAVRALRDSDEQDEQGAAGPRP